MTTNKKSIGSKKVINTTKNHIVPVTQKQTVVTVDTASTVLEQKENTMNTNQNATVATPIVTMTETGTESPALTVTPKKRGGLTKEQRAERAKEMSEIRARLVSNSTSEFRNGTMSPGDFAQVMLDLEKKVEEEYRRLHPKKTATRKGDGPAKGSIESIIRYIVGRALVKLNAKRETPLTRDEFLTLAGYGFDNAKVGKRTKK